MKKNLIMLLEFGGWIPAIEYGEGFLRNTTKGIAMYADVNNVKDWSILMPIYQRILTLNLHNYTDMRELKTALINADLDAFFNELIQFVKWYNQHPALGLKKG